MKYKPSFWIQLSGFLLILLFIYTAVNKLIDFREFEHQMYRQTFARWFTGIVIWTLPEIEIIAAALLIYYKTRLAGFILSTILLTAFTAYIVLVISHYFRLVPCSCGGVIKALGWKAHLVFNLFFLLLSVLGTYFTYRERRFCGK